MISQTSSKISRFNMKADYSPTTALKTVQLSPGENPGYTHAKCLTDVSANRTSELLTINHTLYHTRWKQTFHSKFFFFFLRKKGKSINPHTPLLPE